MLKPQTPGNRGEEMKLQLNPQLKSVCARERSIPSEGGNQNSTICRPPIQVLGNSLQKHHEKGESCRRCTISGIQAHRTNILIWGQIILEILEAYKNTNFEELQHLFDITQKLEHKQGEILDVKTIEWTSPSWTKSTLSHHQVMKWTKERARVYSDAVLCLGKMTDPADANRRWEGQVEELRQTDSYRELFGFDGEPIEFEWNVFPGLTSLEDLRKMQKDLQEQNIEPDNFEDRIIFMSMFNDTDWTRRENSEQCFSNSEHVKNYAKKFT